MKKLLPWILAAGFGILALAALDRSCGGPDPAYWIARSEYDQQTADMTAGLEHAFGLIAERDKTIKLQDEFVALGQRKIMELEDKQKAQALAGRDLAAENVKLKQDAAAAIAANPAVRALVDNYDLRCANYEEQIFTLNARDAERLKILEAKDLKILAVEFQRNTYKKALDDSLALNKACDGLRLDLERSARRASTWAKIGKAAILAAAGAATYAIVKK